MSPARRSWFSAHPVLALLAVNAAIFTIALVAAEVFLRVWVPYNPGYYIAVEGDGRELEYPFGVIKINSDGYADDEFVLEKRLRVGYFGDSVTYGTGAGHGYRVSEYLEAAYPEFEHLNFGGIDIAASKRMVHNFVDIAKRYELTHAIYMLNLNDILPNEATHTAPQTKVGVIRGFVQRNLDWMRGKSYVYTYVRNAFKTYLASRGTGWLGLPTFELFPSQYPEILTSTAERVAYFHAEMAAAGVDLSVVLLPYEMQISEEAAEVYGALGVRWEDGFLESGTQRILAAQLPEEIPVYDAYEAFMLAPTPEASRRANAVGEYFVYDRGDKLDWNHPNREGHRVIADYLITRAILPPPGAAEREDVASATPAATSARDGS